MKTAIIDLGTNTFHLLIVEKTENGINTLYTTSTPAKIGKGGINQRIITEEAIQRALNVLRNFRKEIDNQQVSPERVFATGTSAIRNAENQKEFIERVFDETGIKITVIDGNEEAELIYLGVKEALEIGAEPSVIMDIGGGSVEFIICNSEKILWKQSFEIGGQRLMEKFMKTDPISMRAIQQLDDYFREQLLPLMNAFHQYSPHILIGSSGSFDTLMDIYYFNNEEKLKKNGSSIESPHRGLGGFWGIEGFLPLSEFYRSYEELIFKNHNERMAIKGMIELRVDMIVVAVCLIRYIIQTLDIQQVRVSTYSLKEGLMARLLNQ